MAVNIRFGPFQLDTSTAELHCNGERVRLPEQQFLILEMLLTAQGRLVSREEIRKRLWPNDTVVEFDRSINAAIKNLRASLGDSADSPKYIDTVARRGYRMIVEAQLPESPQLTKPDILTSNANGALTGKKVSHYRVLELLGGGGMGLVYRAEDLKLHRQVALKFLPDEMSSDPKAIRRFEREARAASALNHPNICTIYSVEEHGRQPFIVMELLEGQSLRELIAGKGFTSHGNDPSGERIIQIGIQIAEGLAAAHHRGIIHRDIKPANIFVTNRGQVKILDFGLAKVNGLEPDASTLDGSAKQDVRFWPNSSGNLPTEETLSRTGFAMGTAGYMSPEQVRGEKIDYRTDLYSFGLILFEMATGERAFVGDTVEHVHDAILNREVPPAKQFNSELPTILEEIIGKALRKDREQRFRTASEMLDQLKGALKVSAVETLGPEITVTSVQREARRSELRKLDGTDGSSPVEPHFPVTRRISSPARFWVIPLLVLLLAAITTLYVSRAAKSRAHKQSSLSFSIGTAKNILAVPGRVFATSISPDQKQLAFVWITETNAQPNVFVQLIGEEQRRQLTHNTGGFICCTEWSPDGSQIAYGYCGDHGGSVFVVPVLSGSERKITDVTCILGNAGFPQWANEGRTLVLADQCAPGTPRGIVTFSMDTGEKRCIASPPPGAPNVSDGFPVLGPDQRTVIFIRNSAFVYSEIYAVDLSGKGLRQLTNDQHFITEPAMWAPDGRHILFRSSRPGTARYWQVSADGGPIESASEFPFWGSLSRDGRFLAYPDGVSATASTWQARLKSPGGKVVSIKPITSGSLWETQPQLSPDAKHIVIRSARGRHFNGLWKADADGTNYAFLYEPPSSFPGNPYWSPDGRWIAVDCMVGLQRQIFIMDSEGRNVHALTSGNYENAVPRWSRDGHAMYFSSNRTGEPQIWRRDLLTGREQQITQHGGVSGFEAYDGSALYYSKAESPGLWRQRLSGGPEEQISADLHIGYLDSFAVTEEGIYLVDGNALVGTSIVYFEFKTGKSKRVFTADHLPLAAFPTITASRDGRVLIFSQFEASSRINLAEIAN